MARQANTLEKLGAAVVLAAVVLLFAAYWWTGEMVEAVAGGGWNHPSWCRAVDAAYVTAQGLGLAGAVTAGVGVRRARAGWTSCGVFAVWFGGVVFFLPLLLVV